MNKKETKQIDDRHWEATIIKKEKYEILWLGNNYMNYGRYKDARERWHMSVASKCFLCNKKLERDEMLGMVAIKTKGNKVICNNHEPIEKVASN